MTVSPAGTSSTRRFTERAHAAFARASTKLSSVGTAIM
jgi:hypothetical protein